MYYRKYFSGTISSNTDYRATLSIANNVNQNNYYNQTAVICQAIKSTLEDVGILCEYDAETHVFQIEGISLQILCTTNAGWIAYYANGISIGSQSYSPFSGTSYKFYVTLKGDKDGILQVFIGQYSNPAIESYGFAIGKGIDLRDSQDIRVVLGGGVTGIGYGYILKDDAILAEYKEKVTFGQRITHNNSLNDNGKEITLVECVAQSGRFKLENCYFGHANLTVNEFYNIGGDIYYYISQNILVKCVN